MRLSGLISTKAFPDRTPNRQCWLLFRAGSLSRLREFQQGKVYMNSVQFFSELENEVSAGLRRDTLERNYFKLQSKTGEQKTGDLFLNINGEEIHLGNNAILHLDLPSPKNIFIFCMAAVADGPDGKIPGEAFGEIEISKRFSEFGDHALIIKNNVEFSKRLSSAIAEHPHLYSSSFFEGGHGLIEYVDMINHNGIVGLYRKDMEYSWQREYRFCLGANPEALNKNGALELKVGDLSDISQIVPMEQFISKPIKLRRGEITMIDGEMRHRYTD